MVKSTEFLPAGYTELHKIELQKNKKLAVFINLAAFAIMIVMIGIGLYLVPISTLLNILLEDTGDMTLYFLKAGFVLVGSTVYIILHELTHGIFMKLYCGARVKYGFTGLYAYAGSAGYYNKHDYIIISLAPIVIWGVILAVVLPFVGSGWFWPVYFIQICNISGAAGDLYVTARLLKEDGDILINDIGVSMTVYGKNK